MAGVPTPLPWPRLGSAARRVSEWAVHPLPAYATILLLQLKVVWAMWWVRDFTTGDTSAYFVVASRWYLQHTLDLVWLPLYTGLYYGSFMHLTSDAYWVTIAHRLVLVLALAPLVLAVMRRLLEPRIAWLVTAWWVVLPVNHDVLYEIHLFGVLPTVLAALAVLGPDSRWRRGVAIAILLAGALLVRNELIVPAVMLAAACAAFEARTAWRAERSARPRPSRLLIAYGVPVLVVAVAAAACYAGASRDSLPDLPRRMAGKHGLNVCQAYAFGYQQRHPEWQRSPWLECQDLMVERFGRREPSLSEAFRANPRAMLGHLRWNAWLIPSALQVLLFNSTWGTVRPGYEDIVGGSVSALVLSVVLGSLYLGGAALIARERDYWWSAWLRPRAWGWLTLGLVAASSLLVMVWNRPRPAYVFPLEVFLQAAAGLCLQAVLRRFDLQRWLATAFPLVTILLLAAVPSYYARGAEPPRRPILDAYRTLTPFTRVVQAPGTVFVTPGYGFELCSYVRDASTDPWKPLCRPLDYYALRSEAQPLSGWWALLDARGANLFYANEAVTGDPAMQPVLAGAGAAGWEVVMRAAAPSGGERLLLRKSARPALRAPGTPS